RAEKRPNQSQQLYVAAAHSAEEVEKEEQKKTCGQSQKTSQQALVATHPPVEAKSRQSARKGQPVGNPACKDVRSGGQSETDHQNTNNPVVHALTPNGKTSSSQKPQRGELQD